MTYEIPLETMDLCKINKDMIRYMLIKTLSNEMTYDKIETLIKYLFAMMPNNGFINIFENCDSFVNKTIKNILVDFIKSK